ncbi:MAG: hypothetical protein H6969_12390, partial [Gammaproteobacteria bacterium]|nr:hypothetical protein [Gammaproteobacteria bacterium]MCP5421267.1 hypothetical protein [Gammaproteobacteria bacterium]
MKLGVRTSVLLLALLPTTITALLLGLYQIHSRMQDLLRVHQQQGQALAQHLATTAEYPLLANNDRNLRQLVLATLQEADVVDVVIYNGLGETRMHGRRQANGALRIGPDIARQARTGSVFEAAIVRTALDV